MADNSVLVRPFYRLVANGMEGDRLKATLLITPELVQDRLSGFEFKDWPQNMARILRGVHAGPARVADGPFQPELALQVFAGGNPQTLAIPASDVTIVGHKDSNASSWRRVNDLWRNSIIGAADNKLDDVWGMLSRDIGLSL